jgi:hypothetical protein
MRTFWTTCLFFNITCFIDEHTLYLMYFQVFLFCFCAYRKNPLKFSFNSCLIFLDISLYYLCMSNVCTLIYICIWFYNLFIKPVKSSTYIKTLLKCQHANVFFIYKFLIWFSIMFFKFPSKIFNWENVIHLQWIN